MLGNDVIDLEDVDARPETFRSRFDERVFSAEERRAIARDAASLACRWAHWGAKEAAYKLARQFDPHFVFSPIRLTPRFEPAEMASASSASAAPSASPNWVERRGTLSLPERLKTSVAEGEPRGTTSLGASGASGASGARPGAQELEIRSYETAQSVHVIALPVGSDWDALVFSVEERPLVSSSPIASASLSASALARAPVAAPALLVADPSGAVRALAVREIGRNLGVEADRLAIGRCGKIPTVELDGVRTSLSLSLSHHGRFVAFAMTPALYVRNKANMSSGTEMTSETNVRSEMILADRVMDSVSPKAASE